MLTTAENLLMTLGYGVGSEYYLTLLVSIPEHIGSRIDSLMTSLRAIDEALSAAPLDSMAVKIDKLEVSYTQHLGLLKQEASRILSEISVLLNIPVNYDRYKGAAKSTTKVRSQYNAVSYW